MRGDFCRMCGSKRLRQEKRDILLESQHKKIKDLLIWICEDCQEEFLDDSSRERLYAGSAIARREHSLSYK